MKLFDYLRPHSGHNVEAKLALQKFDHDELHVLKKTWQDLSDRYESPLNILASSLF